MGSILGHDGDDSLLNSLDNGNEEIEWVQTAAAHRVLYSRILGPFFTFHRSLPLQQIGMYHLMGSGEGRDAQFLVECKDISLILIDIIKK
ncbi:hypothetical protein ABD77_10500 [Brevibacillus formosus]|nr:hypothetical protein [Brevibacillus formosus]